MGPSNGGGRCGDLVFLVVMVSLVIVCELSPSVTAGPSKKPGLGYKGRTYSKQFDRKCEPGWSECAVQNLLTCHPKEKKCVCIFTIHEWADAEIGCYNPVEGKPTKEEVMNEKEPDPQEAAELDKEVPPPEGETETDAQRRRRRKFARIQKFAHAKPLGKRTLLEAQKITKKSTTG